MHMHLFTITIGRRESPRLEFAAMATDSAAAFNQHVDLAEVGERVEITLAQRTEEILGRALAKRQQLEDAQREARERAAEEFRRWDAARWAAHKPAEGTYGRLTCSLCGSPSNSQVCGSCSGHLQQSNGRL
jgi:hypothetical protein